MQYDALCSCSCFCNVSEIHLLLDDIAVIAVESDEWCMGGPRMYRTLFRFSQQSRKFASSPHKLNYVKQSWVGDQKLKINLEWPKGLQDPVPFCPISYLALADRDQWCFELCFGAST